MGVPTPVHRIHHSSKKTNLAKDLTVRVLLPAIMVVGCSSSDSGTAGSAQFDTLEGSRVRVTNTASPAWTRDTAWRLEEDLRIGAGAIDGTEVEQFVRISSITTDSRGSIYILDIGSSEIRVFDSSGSFLRTIGRKGEGPGEFLFPSEINIGPSDNLWVLDDGTSRYSRFSRDGTFLDSHPRRIRGRNGGLKGGVLREGAYMDWGLETPDGRFGALAVYHPIRLSPDFEHTDSFPPLRLVRDMLPSGEMHLMYFGTQTVAAVDVEGSIWFADAREYRVSRRSLEGDTTLVFTLPVDPAPIGTPETEFLQNELGHLPDLLAQHLEVLPATKPLLHRIRPDNAGHIFTFVDVAGEVPGTCVDVFREDGLFLGRMSLPTPVPLSPRRVVVAHATSEHLYVVVEDELDVQYVSRLKIIRGN